MTLLRSNAPARAGALLRALRLSPLLGSLALLAACAQPDGPPPASAGAAPASTSVGTPVSPAQLLPAFEWDLLAVRDGRAQNDARWRVAERPPLRLAFKDGRVLAHNLCNLANASYQLDGTQLRITHPVATQRACSEAGLMALEQRVLQQLPTVQTIEVRAANAAVAPAAPHITLRFADGGEWELAGKPTPETRYGSAGERQFLEVAALKVACNHPLMRNLTCLRVRDVTYADNGVKTATGEWRIFLGGIEGYEHREGVRNILRVKRYRLARNGQLPADAPSHAYVLDMVVESEVTP